MSDTNRSFHIGGVDISIDAKEDGTIHLLAGGHVGHFEGDQLEKFNDKSNNEVGNAITFISWILSNTYDAELKIKESDTDITYRITRGESKITDYIESGKRILNTEELYDLFAALEKKYAEPSKVAARTKTIMEYQQKKPLIEQSANERLQKQSDAEVKEAIRLEEEATRAKLHLGHILPAIKWVLSEHIIECDEERSKDILLALRKGQGEAGAVQRQDPAQLAALQARAVNEYLQRAILDFDGTAQIEEQLKEAILGAEQRKRTQQGQGRGESAA